MSQQGMKTKRTVIPGIRNWEWEPCRKKVIEETKLSFFEPPVY